MWRKFVEIYLCALNLSLIFVLQFANKPWTKLVVSSTVLISTVFHDAQYAIGAVSSGQFPHFRQRCIFSRLRQKARLCLSRCALWLSSTCGCETVHWVYPNGVDGVQSPSSRTGGQKTWYSMRYRKASTRVEDTVYSYSRS